MVEERVDVTIGASTEGFEQVQRDAERLTQAAAKAATEQAKGYQKAQADAAKVSEAVNQSIADQKTGMASAQKSSEAYQTEVKRLEERLGDLRVQQQATVRAMVDVDKATPAWDELKKRLSSTNEDIRLVDSALGMLRKSAGAEDGAAAAANELVEGFQKAKHSQRAYRNEIRTLKRELQELAKEQNSVAQALGKTEKGSGAYRVLKDRLRDVGDRSRETETRLKAVERATGRGMPLTEADMAKGAFTQGLVQGAFPGIGPIQRGPGMGRQLVGSAIGRGARGAAQGLFGGVQGMQQMLGAMPVPGAGVLAAQFGQGMSFAGGGLAQAGARFRAAPMLGGAPEVAGRVSAARAAAGRRARETYAPTRMTEEQITQQAGARRQQVLQQEMGKVRYQQEIGTELSPTMKELFGGGVQEVGEQQLQATIGARVGMYQQARQRDLEGRLEKRVQQELGRIEGEPTDMQTRATRMRMRRQQEQEQAPQEAAIQERLRQTAEEEVRADLGGETYRLAGQRADEAAEQERRDLRAPERRRNREMAAAARRARRQMFQPVRAAGRELGGMNEQQAIQFSQQMAQRGGGGLGDLEEQGMLRAGVAAQTAFGVGPEVSGAFQMGGRRGAMVGAQGRAGGALADTIGDALAMGLTGSELTDYMAQMASGIETWKQTGMPINPQSIGKMATEFAQTGVGGVRGGVMGRGMQQGLQRISQEGIGGGVDLMAAQVFGGFQGGGLNDFWEAQKKLEAGGGEEGFSQDQMKEFVQRATQAGGGGTGGLFTLRESMRKMGVQMGVAETEQFAKGTLDPGSMDEEQRTKMADVRKQMAEGLTQAPKGVQGLEADARAMVGAFGKEIQRAAGLQNKQNDIGEKLVPIFQDLQKSSATVNGIFGDLAKGPLKAVSELSVELTGNLEKLNAQFAKAGKMGAWDVWSKIATSMF